MLNEITQRSNCSIDIFSTLPPWFLQQNILCKNFEAHYLKTDVGLVQKSPFVHDLQETIQQLKDFLLFRSVDSQKAITISKKKNFDLIISDISPLGIKIAHQLGVQSVLIENFTWDWIYEEYLEINSGWAEIVEKASESYGKANLHIQTKPFCSENIDSLKIPPISRPVLKNPYQIKKSLGCDQDSRLILLTTGGITTQFDFTPKLKIHSDYTFIVSGDFKEIIRDQNIISLPMNFHEHYPDIVNASSLVVGKVGYGTLSECWLTNTPLIGCYRDNFRESVVLRDFATKNLTHSEISIVDFERMNWIFEIQNISQNIKPDNRNSHPNGACLAAAHIIRFMN